MLHNTTTAPSAAMCAAQHVLRTASLLDHYYDLGKERQQQMETELTERSTRNARTIKEAKADYL
jgi:hypothetical protein